MMFITNERIKGRIIDNIIKIILMIKDEINEVRTQRERRRKTQTLMMRDRNSTRWTLISC
jgi:hypothetical protein